MENSTLTEEKPNNTNRTLIIVAAVVVALCCCLVIVAAAGFFAFTTIRSSTTSPTPFVDQFVPPSNSVIDTPPNGGLGNDILKNDTWQVLVPAAASMGCEQPTGAGLDIEVLQQPDESGVWVEKWPVQCLSGDIYEYEVEFILDDTGATFNIRLLP